ncbi:MAG: YbaK/EbsC family protein [Candidatus Rokubacteria bacterium]|nr:YbaK/EbsC family protein [Candidatus Rokubacteria bacterium]
MNRRLEDLLAARLARYEVVPHPEAVTAQEQAAAAHTSGWSWAKAVLVKKEDGFALAVLPACCIIDLGRLRGLMGRESVELASVEEILRVTPDCEPGAIPPFGQPFGVPTFVDESLVNQREITMPAGDRGTAIRMRATEYVRLAAPRIGHFAIPGP